MDIQQSALTALTPKLSFNWRIGSTLIVSLFMFCACPEGTYADETQHAPQLNEMADSLDIPYPPPKTTAAPKEVKATVKTRLDAAVRQEIGAFDAQALRKHLHEKYPQWQVGDEVDITDGRGRRHKGKIKKLWDTRFMVVNNRTINSTDYTDEIRACVSKKFRKQYINNLVSEARSEYRFKAARVRASMRDKIFSDTCREYGYVMIHGKWLSDEQVVKYLSWKNRQRAGSLAVATAIDRAGEAESTKAALKLLNTAIEDHPEAKNLDRGKSALVSYKRRLFAEEQRAKGLVLYDEQWMTREAVAREKARRQKQKEEMEAIDTSIRQAQECSSNQDAIAVLETAIEKHPRAKNLDRAKSALSGYRKRVFAKKQRAKGLVEYKGRWMTQEAAIERAASSQVAEKTASLEKELAQARRRASETEETLGQLQRQAEKKAVDRALAREIKKTRHKKAEREARWAWDERVRIPSQDEIVQKMEKENEMYEREQRIRQIERRQQEADWRESLRSAGFDPIGP